MDIEEYANKHRHYFSSNIDNNELECILKNNSFKNFIDIGCGDGPFLYALQVNGYLDNFTEIWAVDLSKDRLKIVEQINPQIKTVHNDAQSLVDIPENHFDLIVSRQVIEHVSDDSEMIESLYRSCSNGGIVYIDTVFKKKYAVYFYKNQYGEMALDPTHEREYQNDSELFDKITSTGFKIVYSSKVIQKFALINFCIRRLHIKNRKIYDNAFIKLLGKIKIPVFGYYNWKVILIKPNETT